MYIKNTAAIWLIPDMKSLINSDVMISDAILYTKYLTLAIANFSVEHGIGGKYIEQRLLS